MMTKKFTGLVCQLMIVFLLMQYMIPADAAPTMPTGFSSSIITLSSAKFDWDVIGGATGYTLKRNGNIVYNGASNTFIDVGLTPNTTYTYDLTADDGTGSSPVASLSVTTRKLRTLINSSSYFGLFAQTPSKLWGWGENYYGALANSEYAGYRASKMQLNPMMDNVSEVAGTYSGGYGTSLIVKSDGTLWTSGANYSGELGIGVLDKLFRSIPSRVQSLSNVITASGGGYASYAVKSDGTAWSWGYNAQGQLGINSTTWQSSPVQIKGPAGVGYLTNVVSIAGGYYHALALKSDGTVWAWGENANGGLGDNTTSQRNAPVQVEDPTGASVLTGIVSISAGRNYSVALKYDGTLYAWGLNTSGQLGNNTIVSSPLPIISSITGVTDVVSGYSRTMALKTDGTLWSWGSNGSGEVGDNTTAQKNAPVQIMSNVINVGSARVNGYALKADGTLWSWGRNAENEVGDGTTVQRNAPVQIYNFAPSDTDLIFSGASDTTAQIHWRPGNLATSYDVKRDGVVVYSGALNDFIDTGLTPSTSYTYTVVSKNELGTSSGATAPEIVKTYAPITNAVSRHVIDIAEGWAHSLVLRSDGTVWGVGNNDFGQLGTAVTGNILNYTQIPDLANVVQIATIFRTNYALKSDGTVWAWGLNTYGQIGDNTIIQRNTPVQVLGLTNVTQIAAGGYHALALKSDGTVWAWGGNFYGQLGDNTLIERHTPIQVLGVGAIGYLTEITSIAVGFYSNAAIKADGTLYQWGSNSEFQINTSGNDYKTPFLKMGGVAKVSLGFTHILAIKTDNSLWGWGANSYGQIGTGGTITPSLPFQIMTNVLDIVAENSSSIAIKSDGTLWAWGHGMFGKNGSGDFNNKYVPTQIPGVNNISVLPKKVLHSLHFTTTDGRLWGLGYNENGQIGDATLTNRYNVSQILSPTYLPSAPPNFRAALIYDNQINLAWDASTDTIDYVVKRDGVIIYTGTSLTYSDMGLTPDTSYNYEVAARNDAGITVANLTVTTGVLSLTVPIVNNFSTLTLDGTTQSTYASFSTPLTVKDTTNKSLGWNMSVSASPFTEVGGAGYTLPAGSLTLSMPAAITPTGSETTFPTIQAGSPWVIDNSAVRILSASVLEGMGEYNVSFPANALRLTINPATTKVDNTNYPSSPTLYQSTITWTLALGP